VTGEPPVTPSGIHVAEATEVTDELVAAFGRLIPQLSSSNPPPSVDDVAAMVSSQASVVVVARDGDEHGPVVGSLTLALFRIPTGVRAWIEDVVVDSSMRRRGVGEALTAFALQRARSAGARTVDLTSRPGREAANRLYQRMGFSERDTNVYRFDLND
jgi:ribosomal protein S18 acetylase RimI-like enzyme